VNQPAPSSILLSMTPRLEPTPAGLRQMRLVATGLLLLMAAVYLATRPLLPAHPAWGFVNAFAEAGMVGGMADWFAVTALFRHPLGLPIPHTAIVPENKNRIGEELARFLRQHFLITHVIARRTRNLDVAGAMARWLTDPAEAAGGRFRAGASKLVAQMLEALDPQRLGGMVRHAVAARLAETQVAPIAGQLLKAAMAENRHKPLLDAVIRWAAKALADNDQLIRQIVHDKAGSILRWTGLDEAVSNRLINGLDQLLNDMAENPEHPLRVRAENGLDILAWDLRFDPEMGAKVERLKEELLANPAMQRWLEGLWEQARSGLLAIARDPEKAMAGRLGDLLRQLGETLRDDRRLATTINRFVRRAAVGVAADYGDGIVQLVSETVKGWDTPTIVRRLENSVGRDLQYIRVNGTLVGGLVGLLIHGVDVALG
jgi:uncharacterized membrane-anchored protein YjiN (DUF445 family)